MMDDLYNEKCLKWIIEKLRELFEFIDSTYQLYKFAIIITILLHW